MQDGQLLEQFLCPHTGQILEATKTGLSTHPHICTHFHKACYCAILLFDM